MKTFRERNPFVVGGVSMVVIAALIVFAFSLDRMLFLRGVYLIQADFQDAAGLMVENEVRVAGLRVGKVRAVELAGEGEDSEMRDRVRVTMEVQRGVQLGGATTAEVKLATILGNKFVELFPRGTRPFLEEDDRIPLERTAIPFEIYQVQDEAVDRLGRIDAALLNDALHELAEITHDPEGNLRRALSSLAVVSDELASRESELESLLRSSEVLTAALANRSEELGRILEAGSRVLGALSAHRTELQRFIRATDRAGAEVTGLLRDNRDNLDPALRDLNDILRLVEAHLDTVEEVVRVLPANIEAVGRLFQGGPWAEIWTATLIGLPVPPDLGLPGLLDLLAAGGAP